MGFAPMIPEESITEDELEVVPLLQRGLASGRLDLALFTRAGRAHAEGLRLIVTAWNQVYRARFEGRCWPPAATSARLWSWAPS
jgi:hypothetical protein